LFLFFLFESYIEQILDNFISRSAININKSQCKILTKNKKILYKQNNFLKLKDGLGPKIILTIILLYNNKNFIFDFVLLIYTKNGLILRVPK
jgi:hypothetical protein